MSQQSYQRHGQPQSHHKEAKGAADLKTMERNSYFYGKLLDVFHLEMEQEYFNSKRRIINRLVIGPGVVCGLDVEVTDDGKQIVVLPGLAIDRCGREIIVPDQSQPVALPEMPDYGEDVKRHEYRGRNQQKHELYCEIPYAHVLLCYHECPSDPTPAMAGDCESVAICSSGSIREQYTIEIKRGFAAERKAYFPRFSGGRIDYDDLVEFVSRTSCRALPDDCCIPLANIHLKDTGDHWRAEPDITIRPIVYTNRLLFHLIQALSAPGEAEETEV